MCFSSDYEAPSAPKAVPGATEVGTGSSDSSQNALAKTLERQRQRRGVASTIRNSGGAAGLTASGTGSGEGKAKMGE